MAIILLVGKTRGISTGEEKKHFAAITDILEGKRHEVYNPFLCIDGCGYDGVNRTLPVYVEKLCKCGKVFFLKGWQTDKEAIILHEITNRLGLNTIYEDEQTK
jgi:hypothetical protein